MEFGDLVIDVLSEPGTLSGAISEVNLERIEQIAPQKILKEGPPLEFHIMVGNGQLETPVATTEIPFEVRLNTFVVRFAVMVNLANPLTGLSFLRRNGTLLDMGERTLNFQSVFMQFKDANNSYQKITEPLFNPLEIILQPAKQIMVWVESQIYREHEVTRAL